MKSSDSSIAQAIDSSFRDPSGFVFKKNGELFRQINGVYKDDYDHLLNSGLYEKLSSGGLMIPLSEIKFKKDQYPNAYKIIKPRPIDFISYPYEWCFGQLKDAALTTLEIQKIALGYGMSLKDSSAYNIQFLNGKPVLMDTLSFEKYKEGKPWVAYLQFCRHFLAPLALMNYRDVRLGQLLRTNLDGLPIDLASTLLPLRSWMKLGFLFHLHFHARVHQYYLHHSSDVKRRGNNFSLRSFYGLIDNLMNVIQGIKWRAATPGWDRYYSSDYADPAYLSVKKEIIQSYLGRIRPTSVWDLGANTGFFSRLAADRNIPTIAFDKDIACVEANYKEVKRKKEKNILPLVMDLDNPSSSTGWGNQERSSLMERGPVHTILALALVHHLGISNNVPFEKLASFFYKLCDHLVIEFIPKTDPNVLRLLQNRDDIFFGYHQTGFENTFRNYFFIRDKHLLAPSSRILYRMEKRKK